MTPDHSTTRSRDSDRESAHQRHRSDGQHHGTAAKSSAKSSGNSSGTSAEDREQDSSDRESPRRTAAWVIAAVRSQFADLSGHSVEQVTGVAKGEDSTWTVGVEVLEIRMVPDTADILAQYDVKVDQDGDIIEYRRLRRYLRGRADD